MWAIHYRDVTEITTLDLDDPDIRAAFEADPDVLACTPYDPLLPDLDARREDLALAARPRWRSGACPVRMHREV